MPERKIPSSEDLMKALKMATKSLDNFVEYATLQEDSFDRDKVLRDAHKIIGIIDFLISEQSE